MAVQESVHNVIKHAGAAEVTITIEFTNDLLAITVRDDGSGFNPAGHSVGNGLTNMKQRLSDIGAVVSLKSQPGKGTTNPNEREDQIIREDRAKNQTRIADKRA